MDHFQKQCCRLCLTDINEENFKELESTAKYFLDVLSLKLNFDNKIKHVMCNACSTKLFAAFEFKSMCVYNNNTIIPYADDEKNKCLDLKEVYWQEKAEKLLHDQKVCRLCMQLVREEFIPLHEVQVDMISKYIPEIYSITVKDPVICKNCYDSLKTHINFLKSCLEVEGKIKNNGNGISGVPSFKFHFKTGSVDMRVERKEKEEVFIKMEHSEIKHEESEYGSKTPCYPNDDTIENVKQEYISGENMDETNDQCRMCDDQNLSLINPSDISTFKCNLCDYKTDRKKYLTRHISRHKDPSQLKMYHCDKCGYETNDKHYLIYHELKHKDSSEVQMYRCDKCSFQSKYKNSLKSHQLKHNGVSEMPPPKSKRFMKPLAKRTSFQTDPLEIPTFKCDKCEYETNRKGYLVNHMLIHRDPTTVKIYKCDKCDYQAKRRFRLTNHLLQHKDLSEVHMYKCDKCEYQNAIKRNLLSHQLIHKDASELKMYKCESCSYETKCKSSFQYHQLKHKDPSELMMYKCELCPYETKHKQTLRRHSFTHKDPSERPRFKCGSCDFESLSKFTLRSHTLTHKDSIKIKRESHKCHLCEYEAKCKFDLKNHMLSHSDPSQAKLYKCDECNYETNYKRYLASHQLKHRNSSEVTLYKCDRCTYETNRKKSFTVHQLRHKDPSEVAIYECDLCDYKSKYKWGLKRHVLNHKDLVKVEAV